MCIKLLHIIEVLSSSVRLLVVRKKSPSLHSEASVFVCISNVCSRKSSTAKTHRKRWYSYTEENECITAYECSGLSQCIQMKTISADCATDLGRNGSQDRLTGYESTKSVNTFLNIIVLLAGDPLGGRRRSSRWLFPWHGRLLDFQSLQIPGRVAHAAFAIQN